MARPGWNAAHEAVTVRALILCHAWLLRGRGPAVAVIVVLVLLSHVRRRETPAFLGFGRAGFGRSVRAFGPAADRMGPR